MTIYRLFRPQVDQLTKINFNLNSAGGGADDSQKSFSIFDQVVSDRMKSTSDSNSSDEDCDYLDEHGSGGAGSDHDSQDKNIFDVHYFRSEQQQQQQHATSGGAATGSQSVFDDDIKMDVDPHADRKFIWLSDQMLTARSYSPNFSMGCNGHVGTY